MVWNGRSIGGIALGLLGVCTLFVWGGFEAFISYALAFILLYFGFRFLRTADNALKKICSVLGLIAGGVLLLYWLPKFIALLISAAMIIGGWYLFRTAQAKSFTYRVK
ncbi:hypothetical protein P9314_27160 [Paenibacillus validus]|uniref:Uncharacterized protein n=2 Tax=Paenibacillus validus TaxID=44253 RepID=A0A7X2ZA38_9BACL|nr:MULTISPECIES: hypothetical protein [Paenibacillus]MED4604312.1 hypothetical protein [Paenibacillus validus]MED4605798.1 hypothetical protein [Paenibacillus validus]MUG70433.1 hypothetical protein [Paenibacillus validus]